MSSKRPAAPAPLSRREAPGVQVLDYEFSVATPVFGGGVRIDKETPHHKKLDDVTPVRGASIRGQLRFWWRATHGCTASSVAEMRQRESELWGASSKAGRVSLQVVGATSAKPFPVYEVDDARRPQKGKEPLAYGAFPLQPAQAAANKTAGTLSELKGSVHLRLTVPDGSLGEVRDAVEAWLLFGAVGGRSRRGFGTVGPTTALDAAAFVKKFSAKTTLDGVPSLHGAELAVRRELKDRADDAWSDALRRMREFRQLPVGRNSGSGKTPGRSRWPEPDFIRDRTRQAARNHANRLVPVNKAPRAVFGMPIITHFKDREDPSDTQFLPLDGKGTTRPYERMASPVIVKALRQGKGWVAACLVLADPGRRHLRVGLFQGKEYLGEVEWRVTEAEAAKIKPLESRSNDVLKAFLKYFTES